MSVKKVFALIEFLKEYFSRKHVAKLLLKLPSSFFPNFRIVVNPEQFRSQRKPRRITLNELKNSRITEESDKEEEFRCTCRGSCYPVAEDNWGFVKNFPIGYEVLPECENVKSFNAAEPHQSENRKTIFEPNLFATPPLRKITAEELSSVKLRKSVNFPISPRTPVVNDIVGILRKRFVVMHSPNMLTNYIENEEESETSVTRNTTFSNQK